MLSFAQGHKRGPLNEVNLCFQNQPGSGTILNKTQYRNVQLYQRPRNTEALQCTEDLYIKKMRKKSFLHHLPLKNTHMKCPCVSVHIPWASIIAIFNFSGFLNNQGRIYTHPGLIIGHLPSITYYTRLNPLLKCSMAFYTYCLLAVHKKRCDGKRVPCSKGHSCPRAALSKHQRPGGCSHSSSPLLKTQCTHRYVSYHPPSPHTNKAKGLSPAITSRGGPSLSPSLGYSGAIAVLAFHPS